MEGTLWWLLPWPSPLTVSQRLTALDLEYAVPAADFLPHLPDLPREAVRQPHDGGLHPGLFFDWSVVQEVGFGVQLGAKAVRLPVVPDPRTGEVCLAAGQARAVVALWLGGHATPDAADGLAWLAERAQEAAGASGRPAHDAVVPVAQVDVYGGFVVSLDDLRLAPTAPRARLRRRGDSAPPALGHGERPGHDEYTAGRSAGRRAAGWRSSS